MRLPFQVAEDSGGPVAAARALRDDSGTVFLDSEMTGKGISILGAKPNLILSGSDWERLDRELDSRRREGQGSPDGAAIGVVSFDGTFRFAFYDRLHVFSHESERWTNPPGEFAPRRAGDAGPAILFVPRMREEQFLGMVERAREYIAAGDIYQVCLAHPFVAEIESPPAWEFFERLRIVSPAP